MLRLRPGRSFLNGLPIALCETDINLPGRSTEATCAVGRCCRLRIRRRAPHFAMERLGSVASPSERKRHCGRGDTRNKAQCEDGPKCESVRAKNSRLNLVTFRMCRSVALGSLEENARKGKKSGKKERDKERSMWRASRDVSVGD